MAADKAAKLSDSGYSFGTFKGVYTPSVLTVLGVIMYMRLGWVLGNVGLTGTLLIVTMSSAITFLTGLSISALSTNRRVEGGGAYFIISRSLGIAAGAAVGIPLFFAQALGISFYIAGFSESLVDVFPGAVAHVCQWLPSWLTPHLLAAPAKVIGVATLVVLATVAYISADLALRTQFVVMAAIGVSLVSFFLGGAPAVEVPTGAAVPELQSFWYVFSVFFPAVTGIEAGIAMSGDLRDPARSLPRGTLAAVLTGYVFYIAIPLFMSFVVADRELLLAYPMIMRHISRWGSTIMLGVWAASLSSAMGALLGAPRTLQALARDRVIPVFLGRGFGKGNDPRIATAVAFVVGLAGLLFGDLNLIAPVLSMFFLTSYGLLNVCAGLEELTSPPSWRPRFRVPWGVALFGAAGCFATMFMINAGATFMAGLVSIVVFVLLERRQLRARGGDMRNALLTEIARYAIYSLARRDPDERTWKPNLLVLSGSPTSRWYLVELASSIARGRGLLTIASIVPEDTDPERVESLSRAISDFLEKRAVSALVKVCPAQSPFDGAQMLLRAYGYGPISPNTIMLGETEKPENYPQFARLIRLSVRQKQNIVMVREGDDTPLPSRGRRVDIWWYGSQQNLGLMLALMHSLRASTAWRDSELLIKTVSPSAEDVEPLRERLTSFIERVRIRARAEVIMKGDRGVFEVIREQSKDADLVCMGMRAPTDDEDPDLYRRYYDDLLARTEFLPPTAFVLAAESMDFYRIFTAE